MNAGILREAQRKDLPALVALWQEMMEAHRACDPRFQFASNAIRELERHLAATLRSHEARIFVAEDSGRVVGYILAEVHQRKPIYPVGRYGFITDICVTADYRRKGIGRALVQTAVAWLRSRRVSAVELLAAEANPVALTFWRSMGFGNYLRLLRRDLEQESR